MRIIKQYDDNTVMVKFDNETEKTAILGWIREINPSALSSGPCFCYLPNHNAWSVVNWHLVPVIKEVVCNE